MSGFGNPIIGGGGALVYPSIHSPNYVAGGTGWTINKDGTAQLAELVLIVLPGSAAGLVYSGPPAAGNLVASISAAAGTDMYGNAYLDGFCVYKGTAAAQIHVNPVNGLPAFEAFTGVGSEQLKGSMFSAAVNVGLANEIILTEINGPTSTHDGDNVSIVLQSAAKDGSALATGQLCYNNIVQAHWDATGFHNP